jgi:hypothetical protein
MSEEDQLKDQFRVLARAVRQHGSPALEDRLRAAFRTRVNQQRWKYVARVAAAVVIAAGLYAAWAHKRGSEQESGKRRQCPGAPQIGVYCTSVRTKRRASGTACNRACPDSGFAAGRNGHASWASRG